MDRSQPLLVPYTSGQRPAQRDQASYASQYLTAIAARLTDHGITNSLTCLGGTPVLTIEEPAAGAEPVTVTIDPDTRNGSGLWMECTCLWTPAPGTAPEATADTILTVLDAIRPAPDVRESDHDTPGGPLPQPGAAASDPPVRSSLFARPDPARTAPTRRTHNDRRHTHGLRRPVGRDDLTARVYRAPYR